MEIKELDLLIEQHYPPEKRGFLNNSDLLSLIEETMQDLTRDLLVEKSTRRATFTQKSKNFTASMIPSPSVSELGWGSLTTPDGQANPIGDGARHELARYLRNIEGSTIKEKIKSLNDFFNPEISAPTNFKNPSDQIQKVISYLVFYKTLTTVITNFNASSAGFAFESFLAVLLDADSGRQIPASKGGTIADIVLFKGTLPISVKLYNEKSLKVGGSYNQLVRDLAPETGTAPPMQYMCVMKNLEQASTGDPLSVEGWLTFLAFNFTLDNFIEILSIKEAELELLKLPQKFFLEEIEEIYQSEDFKENLRVPSQTEVDVGLIVTNFKKKLGVSLLKNNLSPEEVDLIQRNLDLVVNSDGYFIDTLSKNNTRKFTYDYKNTSPLTAGGGIRSLWSSLYTSFPPDWDVERSNAVNSILNNLYASATKEREKKRKKGSARSVKMGELKYQSKEKSLERLRHFRDTNKDLYKLALRHTQGFVKSDQFELARSHILSLGTAEGQASENLFPYDTLNIGRLRIGRADIQQMLDYSVESFNESIFNMFGDLESLSNNLNNYIAGGLSNESLLIGTGGAKDNAEDIISSTQEIAGEDS